MTRRIFSLLLALCLIFVCLPGTVSAAEVIASGKHDGGPITWELTSDGTLTITGNRSMQEKYTYEWTPYADQITRVVFSDGITTVPGRVCENMPNLESVYIGNAVESIGNEAFRNCGKLASVTFPASLVEIEEYAFIDCASLAAINFAQDGALETIGYSAFCGTAITSLNIPGSVKVIEGYAFSDCTYLTELTLNEGLTTLGNYAFSHNWDFTGREEFNGCPNLTGHLYLPSTLISYGEQVFNPGTAWTSVTVNTMMPVAFSECETLKEATIGGSAYGIANDMFRNCINLEKVTITAAVESIGSYAFQNCTALTSIELPDTLTSIWFYAFQGSGLTEIQIPDLVTTFGMGAFKDCAALEKVTLGSSISSLDNFMFQNCTSLKKVNLDNVVIIGSSVFENCDGFTSIIIPAGVFQIFDRAFADCDNLSEISFLGDAPYFTGSKTHFTGVTATAYYPAGRTSWTEDVMQNYGGQITWTSSALGVEPDDVLDGVYRIAGSTRYLTSFAIADALKEQQNGDKFDAVIVASGTEFADALAGSYLAAKKDAPILLTNGNNARDLTQYISENLTPGGKVYILGGPVAVSEKVEQTMVNAGLTVKRLAGATRFDTNVAILQEAGVNASQEILVATGYNFADSLSASATGLPILLVNSKTNKLTDSQKEFLSYLPGCNITVIGGTSAVSERLEVELRSYGSVGRLSGITRYQTSVAVANRYFLDPDCVVLAYGQNFPDGLCGGPLAYAMGAPLLLTESGKEFEAMSYASGNSVSAGYALGGTAVLTDRSIRTVFNLAPNETIPLA